jgi:hypothetical protein
MPTRTWVHWHRRSRVGRTCVRHSSWSLGRTALWRRIEIKLHELLELVRDEATLLDFVAALRRDRLAEDAQQGDSSSRPFGHGVRGWENHTISDFLEAASAWAESTRFGLDQGIDPANPWKRFAVFLYCGKIYE